MFNKTKRNQKMKENKFQNIPENSDFLNVYQPGGF